MLSATRIQAARRAVAEIPDEVVAAAIAEEHEIREQRRTLRLASRGTGRRTARCFQCNRFKPRPSTRCDYCGDDPVDHNGCPHAFDRAYGWT